MPYLDGQLFGGFGFGGGGGGGGGFGGVPKKLCNLTKLNQPNSARHSHPTAAGSLHCPHMAGEQKPTRMTLVMFNGL